MRKLLLIVNYAERSGRATASVTIKVIYNIFFVALGLSAI